MQKDTHAGSIILVATAGAVFVLDQLIKKWLVTAHFEWQAPWQWLSVRLSINNGIAFSLPFPRVLLIVLSLIILAAALGWWVKQNRKTTAAAFALGLFIGGAFGNLLDRLIREGVTDYLNIFNGSFNLADTAIVAGLLILIFQRHKKTGTIST